MSPRGGQIRVVVRSRRIPVALTEFELPSYTTLYGFAHQARRKTIAYEYVLEEEEKRILEEVRDVAQRSGVGLEVIDLGRAGVLSRIFRRLFRWSTVRPTPVLLRDQILCTPGLSC